MLTPLQSNRLHACGVIGAKTERDIIKYLSQFPFWEWTNASMEWVQEIQNRETGRIESSELAEMLVRAVEEMEAKK